MLLIQTSLFAATEGPKFFVRGTLYLDLAFATEAQTKRMGVPTEYKFGITVDGCRWFVTTYDPKPVDGFYEANHSSCDGVNVYYFPYRKLKQSELFTGRSSRERRREGAGAKYTIAC